MKHNFLLLLLFHQLLFPSHQQFLSQFIKPGDLVFDVGAFIGKKADLFLACGARVLCIEPQDLACIQMKQKFNGNPNIQIVNVGCADKPDTLTLSIATRGRAVSTFSQEWITKGRYSKTGKDQITATWDEQKKVYVTTLDRLIARYGKPQFCKIDVENFEPEVLTGLSQPISTLCFEFHIEMIHNARRCIERLQKLGYKKFNFTLNDAAHFALTEWVNAHQLLHQLCAHRKKYQNPDLLWGDIYSRI